MRIVECVVNDKQSAFANRSVIRLVVDVSDWKRCPMHQLESKILEKVASALPALGRSARSLAEGQGGLIVQLLPRVAIALQRMTGVAVGFYAIRPDDRVDVHRVMFQYRDPDVGIRAAQLAVGLLCSVMPEEYKREVGLARDWIWTDRRDSFIRQALIATLGFSVTALIESASVRGIAWSRLPGTRIVRLSRGGVERRVCSSFTSLTSVVASDLAADKWATRRILSSAGLPVPKQRMVHTSEQAVLAAQGILYPVVTKPSKGSKGRGVSIYLDSAQQVRDGFLEAVRHCKGVLVEEFLPGNDYRMLVVKGRMVAAARREPATVRGNGVDTIQQLVGEMNQDARRGNKQEKPLTKVCLDSRSDALLAKTGLTRNSVPAMAQSIVVSGVANISAGATPTDVTSLVHPHNREMAELAAAVIGLDVAGIDFISPDIAQSHRSVRSAICEVNAAPGLRIHLKPSGDGFEHDVAGAIIDMLFPPLPDTATESRLIN